MKSLEKSNSLRKSSGSSIKSENNVNFDHENDFEN